MAVSTTNLKGHGKQILVGVMLVVVATFFVNQVATAFNLSTALTVILDFIPTILGLALLLKALDVF